MKFSLFFFCLLIYTFSFAQEDQNWYVFYNQDSTKAGFKNSNGQIQIEPKFETFMLNPVFKNVIAVREYAADNTGKTYYINKNGRKFGQDSVYIFDFDYATESDGKIKFKDYKSDKIGFFDINGKITIPAIYNEAGDFIDGIALVYKDGKRWCYDNDSANQTNCEHFGWIDYRNFVISDKNKILFEIADYKYGNAAVDYTKFKVNQKVDSDICTSYKGSDGNFYSFYSPEKDFEKWFSAKFIPDFKQNKTVLPKYLYQLISSDDNDDLQQNTAWKNYKRKDYLKRKQKDINEIFSKLVSKEFQKSVSWEKSSNYLYFPANRLPEEDLRSNTVINFLARPENDYSAENSFQFTKIGNEFYITSAP